MNKMQLWGYDMSISLVCQQKVWPLWMAVWMKVWLNLFGWMSY